MRAHSLSLTHSHVQLIYDAVTSPAAAMSSDKKGGGQDALAAGFKARDEGRGGEE